MPVGEPNNENFDAPGKDAIPDVIADLVVDAAIPAIPSPIRRNVLKAFGQLCSALIDIPVAHLQGIADERRAEAAGRVRLTNVSAEQIAQQMKVDPEYAAIAVRKFGQRVLREQVNLDMISQRAATEIIDDASSNAPSEAEQAVDEIDSDWLNAFEAEARPKSTEQMQSLFGKILAGEIRRPGSCSIRSVRILAVSIKILRNIS